MIDTQNMTTDTASASIDTTTAQTQQQQQQQAPKRPDYIPEKFWKGDSVDVEQLAKSYAELEKKLSTSKQETQPPKSEQLTVEQQPQSQVPSIPGVSADQAKQWYQELSEKGQLSDEAYTTLEKAGYPRAVVDAYIRGLRAESVLQETEIASIKAIAGGDEGFSRMAEWMKATLSDEELGEYNAAVNSGNKSVVAFAVREMYRRYSDAVGARQPNLLSGKTAAASSDIFRSQHEIVMAMRDPRYQHDEAYRREVAEKISRSQF